MKVDFEFDLEQKVKTKFGEEGFVEMLGIDSEGKKYWVQIDMEKGNWF